MTRRGSLNSRGLFKKLMGLRKNSKTWAKFNANPSMTQEDGGPQRRRLGILLAYHPPREEEGGSRREKWGAGLSQLGFGLGKILTSRSADDSCIEGIGNSPHVVQEVAEEGAAAGLCGRETK
jgi:hypothetical protein